MSAACVNPTRIYKARQDAGLTQADVAYRIRKHGHKANERSIRRWESGQHAPHANVVPALADALGVPMDSLYETSSSDDDEEDDSAAMFKAAYHLERSGDYALADELRLRARRAKHRTQVERSREQVAP